MNKLLVSVIIPACNEEDTIGEVIAEVKKLNFDLEIILVVNGSTDATEQIARSHNVKVLFYPEPLGHDVGRAIGAKHSKGDILLFLDADFIIPVDQLTPFITDIITRKLDITLNAYPKTITKQNVLTSSAKALLNHLLNRSDLESSSMTNVPHAITKKALEIVDYRSLAVPPLALTKAVISGLKVGRSHDVPLYKLNKKRKRGSNHPLIHLVMSDHLKALKCLFKQKEEHFSFKSIQDQTIVERSPPCPIYSEGKSSSPQLKNFTQPKISVLIFALNAERFLGPLIKKVNNEEIHRIIVVDLNSSDQTFFTAARAGAHVFSLHHLNTASTKRKCVSKLFESDYFLVLNTQYTRNLNCFDHLADFFFPLLYKNYDLAYMYIKNNYQPNNTLYLGSIFLHHCLRKEAALFHFPWFSPFALSKKAVQKLGIQTLLNPFAIYTLAVLNDLKIKSVKHHVVINNPSFENTTKLEQLFIKDISSAFYELIKQKGPEGCYTPALRAVKKI